MSKFDGLVRQVVHFNNLKDEGMARKWLVAWGMRKFNQAPEEIRGPEKIIFFPENEEKKVIYRLVGYWYPRREIKDVKNVQEEKKENI